MGGAANLQELRTRKELLIDLLQEDAEDVEPPPDDAPKHWSEKEIRAYFASEGSKVPAPPKLEQWVTARSPPEGDPAVRLLCFHHAGGNSVFFKEWITKQLFPSHFDIIAVELPGRRETTSKDYHVRMRPLAEELAEVLTPVLDGGDKPFIFFGHSLGALVSFELTRELRRQGRRLPSHLVMSCRVPPQVSLEELDIPELHQIEDDDAFVDAMVEHYQNPDLKRVTAMGGDIKEGAIRPLKADMELFETYVPCEKEEPFPVSITAYAGKLDAANPVKACKRWQEHTTGSFVFKVYEGGHFFWRPSAAQLVADIVTEVDLKIASGTL
mmetsp:Transcript_23377/g.76101  ORF Transcript_23377/g.76101 Transcript_23377/m.76101 type:complete len:326 (+) Transcript_23377:52-1029(+)